MVVNMGEIDAQDHWLSDRIRSSIDKGMPGAHLIAVKTLEGGHSGHTLVIDIGDGPVDRAVVKSGAPGRAAVGRHDVLRQARVMRALAGADGFPVPRVLLPDPGDPPLFLMTFEPGEAKEPVLDGNGEMPPALVSQRAVAAARMLAALHA